MSNNYDIKDGGEKKSLDVSLSGAAPENNAAAAAQSDDRQKKAQMMARQIAMNIGSDYDDDEELSQTAEAETHAAPRQLREEATRERTVPSRPVRESSHRSSSGSTSRSGSSRRPSSQQRSSSQRSSQQRPSQQRGASQRRDRDGGYPSRNQQRRRRRKKSSGVGTAIGFMLGFIIVLLGVGYFVGLILTNGTFLPNSTIILPNSPNKDQIDVSKLTLADATKLVADKCETSNLVMHKADGSTVIINAKDFDYVYDVDTEVQKIFSSIDRKLWFKSLFGTNEYTIKFDDVPYDEAKLSQELDKIVWGVTEPQNAYITRTSEGYIIVDATRGDKVDYSILKPYILDQVSKGNLDIYITDCDCFYEAEIQAADLQEKLEQYQSIGDITIKINFDFTEEELTIDDYSTWMQFADDGSYSVNRADVEQYVGYLADTYDTYGTSRKFHATIQGDRYVAQGSQGTYGWKLDQEKTTDKIIELLEAGKSDTIDPVYATRLDNAGNAFFTYKAISSVRSADDDIGPTYIEVDLTNQHIWYYENNELKFETDQVVSGLASDPKRITPEGVYEVLDKKSPYYMNGDGYSNVYCKYFIRVSYEGVGFHDLSRGSYGGQIYLTNGSHGCLNMKQSEVAELYGMVAGGTPVIMYY